MLVEKTKNLRRDFTATGYVTNPERTKILVIFHNKLQRWLPAGGHKIYALTLIGFVGLF